jgi:hypothetical protein
LAGNIYVNVHSNNFGSGEIRGQVLVDYGIGLSASLDGAQEVPPVATTATGTGAFFLKSSSSGTVTELEYHITVAGLSGSIQAAHFHNAPAGTNGGIVRNISFNGNTAEGSWKSNDANQPLTQALLVELLTNRLYVNVHTAANTGGEIRGQVRVTTGIGFTANVEGAQEVPPVTTTATGTGTFTLNNDGTELVYDITATNFSARVTAAHFHNAAPGVAGSVVRDFNFLTTAVGGPAAMAVGVWKNSDATQSLTPPLVIELLRGNIYANFHTSRNTGGEIRGQLKLNLGISFSTKLTGAQEAPTPVLSSRATGTGAFVLADGGNELTYSVTYANLGSSFRFAHFHNAATGVAGPIVRDISFNGNTANGSWKSSDATQPLTSALLIELLGGRLYVNVHSNNFGSGEIRGQVVRDVNTLPLLLPIGTSRTLADSTVNVNLQGVVTTVDFQLGLANTEYYFQDPSGGLRVFIRGKIAIPQGTVIRVKNGFVYTINNRKNIEVRNNQVEILATPGLPPPRIVTINEYKTNQAAIEGQYIGIIRASLKSGTWPSTGANGTVYLRDASIGANDSLAMFIDLDTDIDGSPVPTSPFDVLGVATQFNGVAQIQPSLRADFRPAGGLPVELVEFRANAIGVDVELTWRTASETNSYGFEIQRKQTNSEFQKIGFVPGHGSTQQAQSYRYVDSKLALGTYYYRLKQIDTDGSFTFSAVVEAIASIAPETFELRQNHPNPFNPVTMIEFVLGRTQPARLAVYNVLGHEVAILFNGQVEAGKSYRLEFDGAKYASGIYFYRLQSGERTQIRKMLLSK